jgi:hypothetical protein
MYVQYNFVVNVCGECLLNSIRFVVISILKHIREDCVTNWISALYLSKSPYSIFF